MAGGIDQDFVETATGANIYCCVRNSTHFFFAGIRGQKVHRGALHLS